MVATHGSAFAVRLSSSVNFLAMIWPLTQYIRPYIRRRLVWQSHSAVGQYDVEWADMSYVMHFRLFTKIKQLQLGNQHMEKSDFNNFYTGTRNLKIL